MRAYDDKTKFGAKKKKRLKQSVAQRRIFLRFTAKLSDNNYMNEVKLYKRLPI